MTYSIMLDSGGYSAYTQGTEIFLDEYMQFIEDNKDYVDYYVNLDVIGDGHKSYVNYMVMVKEGFNPIPVFHIGSDERYLKKYLSMTDYVAIGAIAKMQTTSRLTTLDKVWHEYLTDKEGKPVAKIHGFGLTSFRIIRYFPWHSVDSSSWVQYGKFGIIIIPKYRNGDWDYDSDPLKIIVSSRKTDHSQHILNLPASQKKMIRRYLHTLGYDYDAVSTNSIARDTVNLAYLLGLQKIYFGQDRSLHLPRNDPFFNTKMLVKKHEFDPTEGKMYIAGNFPVMGDIEKERAVKDKYPTEFHRLISYYFKKDIINVLQLKKEDIENGNN